MKNIDVKELIEALNELEKERGIDKAYLIESLEAALVTAYKKNFDSVDNVKITKLINPIIIKLGYELYDVLYIKEGKEFILRIVIDSKTGIDINDCEKVNNKINDCIDEADYISEPYLLEVSSPGVERILRKDEHFEKQLGNKIMIKLFQAIDKQKEVIGILEKYNKDELIIKKDNREIVIEVKNIALAKTVFDW